MNERSAPTPPFLTYLLLLLVGLVGVAVIFRFIPALNPSRLSKPGEDVDPTAQPRKIAPVGDLFAEEKATIDLYTRCKNSVVNVTSLSLVRNRFSLNVLQIPRGSGTGFVWDEKGRMVTNYHVVKDANKIRVTLADHSSWNVTQVQYDENRDIAVLWTDAPKDRLKPLPLGESATLQVGQKVFAIGNPFGLDQSLTTGIISALGREIDTNNDRTIKGVIQTDAAINPGNSGGPLLDSSGRLIGVNTAILSPSGSFAGIGFAIPIDEVNRVVPRLLRAEKAVRPTLGIVTLPGEVARPRGLAEGVLVLDLAPNGPAAKAGLRATTKDESGEIVWGDVITAIEGEKIRNSKDLFAVLEGLNVGQVVTVTVRRDGEDLKIRLTLGGDSR